MAVINIPRSRLFNLFLKSVCSKKISETARYHKYGIIKVLPNTPKCICFASLSLICVAKATGNLKEHNDPEAVAIAQSDEFFSVGKYKDSFRSLEPFKDSKNAEVLWRISRNLFNMSKDKGIKSSDVALLINEAFQYIQEALKLDGNNYAVHKWMAILIDAKSALEGIKARINTLPVFKKHLMAAIELNPKDATSIYMLGQYMYNIADMSWLQQTIAKTLFGAPPKATFEEAFFYFSKAEEVDPNFYSANLLMLGKTCLKLKKIEMGCYWLKCAIAYPVRTDEDEAVRIEAEELLQKYSGVKEQTKEKQAHNTQ